VMAVPKRPGSFAGKTPVALNSRDAELKRALRLR